jgi:hypothetical protein
MSRLKGEDGSGGVDPLGAEPRMRGRQFARCLERASTALEAGSLDEYRAEMEEARVLFANAPEIADLERSWAERQGRTRFVEEPDELIVFPSEASAAPVAAVLTPRGVPDSFLRSTHIPRADPARGLRLAGASAAVVAVFSLIGYGLGQLYIGQPPQAVPRTASASREEANPGVHAAATSPAPPIGREPIAPDRIEPLPVPPPVQQETPFQSQPIGRAEAPSTAQALGRVQPERSLPPSFPGPAATPAIGATPPGTSAEAMSSRPLSERGLQPQRDIQDTRPSSPPMATGVTTGTSATTVAPLPGPPAAAAALRTPPAAPAARVDETPMIRMLLQRYEMAYNRLDPASANTVLPGVNSDALDGAFSGLVSQKVSLGLCDITITGDIGGASCTGKVRWEPRVGGSARTADRHWKFDLRRGEDGWRIEQVLVR